MRLRMTKRERDQLEESSYKGRGVGRGCPCGSTYHEKGCHVFWCNKDGWLRWLLARPGAVLLAEAQRGCPSMWRIIGVDLAGDEVRRSQGRRDGYVSPVRAYQDIIMLYVLAGRKIPQWMKAVAAGDPLKPVGGWEERAGALRR